MLYDSKRSLHNPLCMQTTFSAASSGSRVDESKRGPLGTRLNESKQIEADFA
ncbi:MAG: hypothetical protein IH991_19465 [Planctomycetes bacterium]|nr:hypothetical protein [Planctomycetota bacterium]